jgi:thiopeptide-type bacteriocin biosynthesis protein
MTGWSSTHIFYSHPDQADLIVLKLRDLMRIIQQRSGGNDCRWFFIRYFDGGAHIRFRTRAVAALQVDWLRAQIADYVRAINGGHATEWYDQTAQMLEERQIYPPGSVVEIDYVPELQRYGGASALPLNEDLFCASTNVVCQIIVASQQRKIKGELAHLITKAAFDLMMMNVAVITRSEAEARSFLRKYAASWAHFVSAPGSEDWKEILDENQPVSAIPAAVTIARYRDFLAAERPAQTLTQFWGRQAWSAFARLEALAAEGRLIAPLDGQLVVGPNQVADCQTSIMASQIHMMNNRLGQFPRSEAVIALRLARAFGPQNGLSDLKN